MVKGDREIQSGHIHWLYSFFKKLYWDFNWRKQNGRFHNNQFKVKNSVVLVFIDMRNHHKSILACFLHLKQKPCTF
jgi:hypothetical protein